MIVYDLQQGPRHLLRCQRFAVVVVLQWDEKFGHDELWFIQPQTRCMTRFSIRPPRLAACIIIFWVSHDLLQGFGLSFVVACMCWRFVVTSEGWAWME